MRWAVAGGVVLALLLVGGQWWWSSRHAAELSRAASYYDQFPTEGTRIGPADAPVRVEEYFDFQCPHCHTASEKVVRPLIEQYVADGSVSFTYKFFPILGPESVLAARAAYCAAEMDAFWVYQEVLFAKKGMGNRGTYSKDNLISYARQIGLNTGEFQACLDGERSLQYVRNAYDAAVRMGLQGTPTFVVNGRPLVVSSWEDVLRAVDRAVAAVSR